MKTNTFLDGSEKVDLVRKRKAMAGCSPSEGARKIILVTAFWMDISGRPSRLLRLEKRMCRETSHEKITAWKPQPWTDRQGRTWELRRETWRHAGCAAPSRVWARSPARGMRLEKRLT